ncbi:G2/M phase-specific E3 ubiquitin-protein ligase-like [Astyanax mexicanus]|uniref:G2/M phase-specific E3 ubiquitin-protein ligase-like n=1 Tax=Astyanax mexicanus TaxID=7994 RepID=A0A8T2L1Z6_ASTMX|nr:G2/M phase-specific E3 ubiquitin-protein ligase-like [Astyanax mexicanus]
MLQTAECFQYVKTLEKKENINKDFMQWYIIYQNHFSIRRFNHSCATVKKEYWNTGGTARSTMKDSTSEEVF